MLTFSQLKPHYLTAVIEDLDVILSHRFFFDEDDPPTVVCGRPHGSGSYESEGKILRQHWDNNTSY